MGDMETGREGVSKRGRGQGEAGRVGGVAAILQRCVVAGQMAELSQVITEAEA